MDGGGLDDIAVGEPGASLALAGERLGRVYVFFAENHQGCPSLGLLDADLVIQGSDPHGWFGWSLAGTGDVIGDGLPGLIVGAPGAPDDDGSSTTPGSAYVFGGSTLLALAAAQITAQGQCVGCPGLTFFPADTHADWILEGDADNDRFGWAVASVGDVDGDGDDDIVVSGLEAREDHALVYDVRESGYARLYRYPEVLGVDLPSTPAAGYATFLFGRALAGGVDINGDGRPDILVGAPYYRESGATGAQGAVFAFSVDAFGVVSPAYGSGRQPVTWDLAATQPAPEVSDISYLGWDVAVAGDHDADPLSPFNDWIAGAPGFTNVIPTPNPIPMACLATDNPQGGRLSGRVLVVSGGNALTAWPPRVIRRYKGEGADKARMGMTVACGFLDDAGAGLPLADAIAGSVGLTPTVEPSGFVEVGRVYAFLGEILE